MFSHSPDMLCVWPCSGVRTIITLGVGLCGILIIKMKKFIIVIEVIILLSL